MNYWSTGATPLSHRGLDFLALIAGTIAALPLAAIVAMTVYLVG